MTRTLYDGRTRDRKPYEMAVSVQPGIPLSHCAPLPHSFLAR